MGGAKPTDWARGDASGELAPHRVLEPLVPWTRDYERDEHGARVRRLRQILIGGALAWLFFLPTDLSFNVLRGEGNGLTFVIARVLATIPLLFLWVRLGRDPAPRAPVMMALEGLVISVIAGTTGYMAAISGGLASPILAGLLPILVVRAVAIPEPWQRGLPLAAAPATTFWLVLGLGLALSEGGAEIDGATLASLCLHLGMQVVTIAMITIGNHTAWDVRRSLYKARSVGRYELLRPLGRGAMGEVWVAWHQGLRQEVALKILPVNSDRAGVARFEREVAATIKLRHPNTVRVYDFGLTHDGLWYYAMELLEGETLAQLVARDGPLGVARALGLVRQAARALDEAHAHGVVHRDIKPENLFVARPAGEVDVIKILDFGVASIAAEAAVLEGGATEPLSRRDSSEADPTEPGYGASASDDPSDRDGRPERSGERSGTGARGARVAVGTPLYISPEVARGGAADRRSDIYALGCVLYYMLTARPVFVERGVAALLRAHATTPPTPPSDHLAEPLPDYVETLVLRCLAKDPEQRYDDAPALVRALDLCLRLGDLDRRRGAGESQLPRVRTSREVLETWTAHSGTETDMTALDPADTRD